MEIIVETLFHTLFSGVVPNARSFFYMLLLLIGSFIGIQVYNAQEINAKQQQRLEVIESNANAKGFNKTLNELSRNGLDGVLTKGEYSRIKKAYKYDNKIFKHRYASGHPIEIS